MNDKSQRTSVGIRFFHVLVVACGSVGLTLVFFLVLPLMQTISKPRTDELIVRRVETANLPRPEIETHEEEIEEEEEPEEETPELEEAPPLSLSDLELALDPGFGTGVAGADFGVKLATFTRGRGKDDALFSPGELDRKPRAIYQPNPVVDAEVRKAAPGKVYVIFIVDQSGRVVNPIVKNASDPIFEKPAVDAVKKWKFEPGKRQGKPVQFRMGVPITFPEGL